jgi:type III secretory pathway component EscU
MNWTDALYGFAFGIGIICAFGFLAVAVADRAVDKHANVKRRQDDE